MQFVQPLSTLVEIWSRVGIFKLLGEFVFSCSEIPSKDFLSVVFVSSKVKVEECAFPKD